MFPGELDRNAGEEDSEESGSETIIEARKD
jgi:hypothetical protein